jgi:hypothetical protein
MQIGNFSAPGFNSFQENALNLDAFEARLRRAKESENITPMQAAPIPEQTPLDRFNSVMSSTSPSGMLNTSGTPPSLLSQPSQPSQPIASENKDQIVSSLFSNNPSDNASFLSEIGAPVGAPSLGVGTLTDSINSKAIDAARKGFNLFGLPGAVLFGGVTLGLGREAALNTINKATDPLGALISEQGWADVAYSTPVSSENVGAGRSLGQLGGFSNSADNAD